MLSECAKVLSFCASHLKIPLVPPLPAEILGHQVCELPRHDGRLGVLRSQINFTPEGHVHIR